MRAFYRSGVQNYLKKTKTEITEGGTSFSVDIKILLSEWPISKRDGAFMPSVHC